MKTRPKCVPPRSSLHQQRLVSSRSEQGDQYTHTFGVRGLEMANFVELLALAVIRGFMPSHPHARHVRPSACIQLPFSIAKKHVH